MSKPQKMAIRLGDPNQKNRSKAMQLASKFAGVNAVGIAGDGKDQLEVTGEGVDVACLVTCLRKKVCRADVVKVEEVKDKKKEEEEKKKKEAEEKKKKEEEEKKKKAEELSKLLCTHPPPGYCHPPPGYYHPPPTVICDDQPASCHIM